MARVVVIGAGQAGLATSFCLTKAGVEHVVLERSRIASAWRERWNSFCLVSPNWSVQLPGGAYDGDDPDGFMRRDQLVAYFERYASGFAAPVREGVRVRSLLPLPGGGFRLNTADGALTATEVVVATGAYQRPFRPAAAQAIPRDVVQLDVGDYRAPDQLSAGTVLVVAKDSLRESSSEYAQGGIAVALSDDDEVSLEEIRATIAGDGPAPCSSSPGTTTSLASFPMLATFGSAFP